MRLLIYILCTGFLISCGSSEAKKPQKKIARVNNSFLYEDAIEGLVPENMSKADSTHIVNNFINRWATKQLFMDQTKLNLTAKELEKYDILVEDYRSTLYINAYKDGVIAKSLDLEVTDQQLRSYYKKNKKNFNLNQELIKLRYIQLPRDYKDVVATQKKFSRYNDEDKIELENRKDDYIRYSFNDSIWMKFNEIINIIPPLKKKDRSSILKKEKYMQLRDSLGVYLAKINKVLERNQTAPFEYVKPKIRQIIINRRKLDLVKKLEKDITKDAIKNQQFEVYN